MARKVAAILSHWHKSIEGLPESPQRFYDLLNEALHRRKLPDIRLSRVNYAEGGIFSSKREYFRVQRGERLFDVCAAPYGTGFFISWWMGEAEGWLARLWKRIPLLSLLIARYIKPLTYYQIDVALMFQDSIHTAVMDALDQIIEGKGIRALSESERKPVLSSLLQGVMAK